MIKLLYILNTTNRVNNFSYSSMCAAKNLGVEFHIAGNWGYDSDEARVADEQKYGIKIHQVDFIRNPYHPKNRKAYKQLENLVKTEAFEAIHCNTPIGGLLGRLVGKKCHVKKVIYQVHGFHFYKGAPKLNWMLYYPIEKWLTRYTDSLITINSEDCEFAQRKLNMRNNGNVYYVPGVGIDSKAFLANDPAIKAVKRQELGIPEDAMLLISAGELNANKNNSVIIDAMATCENKNIYYILCGVGPLEEELRALATKNGVADRVQFLGFRSDMKELLAAADVFVMPSFREGLSRSIMEAMSSGLPCVVSNIRGNVDLIENGVGGYLCEPSNIKSHAEALDRLAADRALRQRMSVANLEHIKGFDLSLVIDQMTQIYENEFRGI